MEITDGINEMRANSCNKVGMSLHINGILFFGIHVGIAVVSLKCP